jgi:hypothetical protein
VNWFSIFRTNVAILVWRLTVRALILFAIIILVMALIGWVSFGTSPGRSSINLETDQIRQDTREALDTGADVLHKAEDAVRPDDATNHVNEPAAGN